MHFIKHIVNKLTRFVSQRIHFRVDGKYLCLPARFEWHFRPTLRWYLDEAFRLQNGKILGNELSQQCHFVFVPIDPHSVG